MIQFLHIVSVAHAVDTILRTWNMTSHNPPQTCCLLKCQRVNMHCLTFPVAGSEHVERRLQQCHLSCKVALDDTSRKGCEFTAIVFTERELILFSDQA